VIVDSVLTNAKAYLKQGIVDCSIAIEDGKIFKISKETQMPSADEKTDLHNQLVLPGVIDSHVHLRDEKRAYKETFRTGTAAAAAGGVTTVLDMPNNAPVTMSVATLQNRMQLATKRIHVNVGFYSEFPANLNEIKNIADAGAIGFKLFLAEQVGGLNIDNDEKLKEAFKKIAELNVPVAVHAEDHQLLTKAVEEFKLAKRDDLTAFLKAHDERIETTSIMRMLKINTQINKLQLHFCHLSTEAGLKAVTEAKKAGTPVTCEATPHHLLLSKADYEHLGMRALTLPPLRTKENMEALCKGITENVIDTIGSDHAPHTLEEKESRNVWDIKGGIPGLETTLPLVLTMVHKKQLMLSQAVQLLSERPAKIFGLEDRGTLEPGKNADLVVVDFNAKFKIDATKFLSKAKYSPFNGWETQGKPVKTFVNGQLVMDEQEVTTKAGRVVVAREKQTLTLS
jgi:dihydroorotase